MITYLNKKPLLVVLNDKEWGHFFWETLPLQKLPFFAQQYAAGRVWYKGVYVEKHDVNQSPTDPHTRPANLD